MAGHLRGCVSKWVGRAQNVIAASKVTDASQQSRRDELSFCTMALDFSGGAQKLARNPLGIIALFLLLVYGVAGLVFSTAAKTLTPTERQPLIWFLVGFPILVLWSFGWLVARHHTKLYAPSDYSDPEGFFRALSVVEQRARLDAETDAVQKALPAENAASTAPLSGLSATSGSAAATSRNDESSARSETGAGSELGRRELRTAILLAQELVFRELEAEFKLPVLRNVQLPDGPQVDGLVRTPPNGKAITAKYIRSPKNVRNIVRALVLQGLRIYRGSKLRVEPLLVLVVDSFEGSDVDLIRQILRDELRAAGVEIENRVYDFVELQRKFGVAPPNSR